MAKTDLEKIREHKAKSRAEFSADAEDYSVTSARKQTAAQDERAAYAKARWGHLGVKPIRVVPDLVTEEDESGTASD